MYKGEVSDIPADFEELGHTIPSHYNPGDYMMMISQTVSVADLEKQGFFLTDMRADEPTPSESDGGKDALAISVRDARYVDDKRVGVLTQIKYLLVRELKNMCRNRSAMGARFFLTIFMSLLIGCIFLGVAETDYCKSDTGSLSCSTLFDSPLTLSSRTPKLYRATSIARSVLS